MPDSKPLVLLPGLLCDDALWRHQLETLGDLAEMTVADLTGDNSVSGMAASVLRKAPDSFCLAGLSMGGYVAQEIMRQAPDRVRRLALLDTSYLADTQEQKDRRQALLRMAEQGEFKGVTDRLLPVLIHADRLEDEALTGVVKDMAKRVGKEAFLRQQTAIMNRPDGTHDLGLITSCPTVVVCGRQDALTPYDLHLRMAARIPGARFVVIEESGHLSPLERPQAVSAVLRYWLQG
jgi:pimeloyl-ACP methyl ester carboxylesterase